MQLTGFKLKIGDKVRFAYPLKHNRKHHQTGVITRRDGAYIYIRVFGIPDDKDDGPIIVERYPNEVRNITGDPWPIVTTTL